MLLGAGKWETAYPETLLDDSFLPKSGGPQCLTKTNRPRGGGGVDDQVELRSAAAIVTYTKVRSGSM